MRNFFKLNDKGSTFVTVIVSIGFIGVLASLVLVVTQNSYVTKSVDNQAKVNFYDSEEVVDQLKIGLQNELCECMIDAYFKIIATYNVNEAESVRRQRFNKETLGNHSKGFVSRISTGSNGKVSTTKLKDLISDYYLADSEDAFSISGKKSSTSEILYEIAADFSTITLRNVGVEYINESGYINSLFTDIVISIPEPDFSMFDPDPNREYEKYAIMARYDVNNGGNVLNTKGSVWIGDYANITGSNARFVTNGEVMFIRGGVNVTNSLQTGGNYSFSSSNGGGKSLLFAGNLITDNTVHAATNAININADTYVNNDLVFEGNNATVNVAGTYSGFGQDSENPDKSSAIIVNGKNNKLNMNTTNISLAGSSYIKTFNNGNYTVPNSDKSILTGDALSIRSNELAYLVPSEYMQGLPNPVTRNDLNSLGISFETLSGLVEGAVESDSSISGLVDGIRVLYYTYSTDPNDRVAYFYLNFTSAASGANFYMQKVNSKVQTRNMLLGLIPVRMTVNSSNFFIGGMYAKRLYANNNGLTSEAGNPTFVRGSGNTTFVSTSITKYNKVKSFLTTDVPVKLQQIDNGLADAYKFSNKDAIDNIINWQAIEEDGGTGLILGDAQLNESGASILGKPVSGPNITQQLKVRVYRGPTYNLNENITGIVIATGDINVAAGKTVNGLIIAGGSIHVNNGASFIADPVVTRNVFDRCALVKTQGGIFLNKILNGYEPDNQAGKETKLSTLELEGMFSYENWCRD